MTRRHKPSALTLALILPGVLVAGCGGAAEEEPTSYLVTDLAGGTAAPDAIPVPDPTATKTTAPRSAAPTGDDLVALVGAAAGAFDGVRVTQGSGSPPADIAAEVTYGDANDFAATVFTGPDRPATLVSRVEGTLYVGSEDKAGEPVPAGQLSPGSGGSLPIFFAWNPLLDLRAALEGAQNVAPGGPDTVDGAAVTSYTFTLDLDELPRPSLIVPDDISGDADVALSLGADDLPVRLKFVFKGVAGDTTVVLTYSDWGGPGEIVAPSGS